MSLLSPIQGVPSPGPGNAKTISVSLLNEGKNESVSPVLFPVESDEEGKYLVLNVIFFP